MDAKNREGVAAGLRIGSAAKERGNACVKQKDRAGAVEAYTAAVNALEDGLAQNPERDEKRDMKQMLVRIRSSSSIVGSEPRVGGVSVKPRGGVATGRRRAGCE